MCGLRIAAATILDAKPFAFLLARTHATPGLLRSANSSGLYKALRNAVCLVREILVYPCRTPRLASEVAYLR